MISKKKEFFLLIFLILLQSCSGGRIGNFLESSFNDLEKISQDEDLKKNLEKKSKDEDLKNNLEKKSKDEDLKKNLENKKFVEEKNQEIDNKNDKTSQKVDNSKIIFESKKDTDYATRKKQKNNQIKNSSRKKKVELQSYKIILILNDVDPKDPTEELNTILRNSEVNFEIEKIERILDSKNKSMNKN